MISIRKHGHEVSDFLPAEDANSEINSTQPPISPNTIVTEMVIDSSDRFVRVYDSEDAPGGPWMMRPQSFADLETRKGVLNRFALSEDWKDYDAVAETTITSSEASGKYDNFHIWISTGKWIYDEKFGQFRAGGATQYYACSADKDISDDLCPYVEYLEFEPMDKSIEEYVSD